MTDDLGPEICQFCYWFQPLDPESTVGLCLSPTAMTPATNAGVTSWAICACDEADRCHHDPSDWGPAELIRRLKGEQ